MIATILVIAVASLVTSIWMTEHRPTWAFYLLPARMVELLAGAAIATAGPAFRAVNAGLRAALGWFGLVGICVAAMTYDVGTVFPGYMTLLPVLATVLVIVAGGQGGSARGPVVVLRHPVAQWVGRHSYAIYLWHWPVLVLFEAEFGPLAAPDPARSWSPSPSACRPCRCVSSRIPCATHRGWPSGRFEGSPSAGRCGDGGARRDVAAQRRRTARFGRVGRRADARPADDRGSARPRR